MPTKSQPKPQVLTQDQETLLRVATAPGKYILLAYGMYPVVIVPGRKPKYVARKSQATRFPTMLAAHDAATEAKLEGWSVKELR